MPELPNGLFIHTNKASSKSVLFDAYSGSKLVIPASLNDVSDLEDFSRSNGRSLQELIEPLIHHRTYRSKRARKEIARQQLHELRLIVTNRCNFRCRYCFANGGAYGLPRTNMTVEIAEKAIDYFYNQFDVIKQISFFGGEPLLALETIEAVCNYVDKINPSYRPSFSLVTNGWYLTPDVVEMLCSNHISVVGSIDGQRSINDSMRVLPNGMGTFSRVDENLRYYASLTNNLSIEATYTLMHVNNCISRTDLRKYLYDRYDAKFIKIADVINNDSSNNIESFDKEWFPDIDRFISSKGTIFDDTIWDFIYVFLMGSSSRLFCPAGVTKYSVDMFGDIFPCHIFVGKGEYRIGSIHDSGGLSRDPLCAKDTPTCLNCAYRPYCRSCMYKVLRGGSSCAQFKKYASVFLHALLELYLVDRGTYDEIIQRWFEYGRKSNIRTIRK